ncbi:Uncharacterised protein [Neisseria zoodegmatis]|uniref:Uncharacterized protein n=1 Tax=Neisseria zoodegmatis TaxID=326523 RepID=A0A378WT00_9NEIS|nr:Uncharacterised protein [Neisseria zoodegmatis]
MVCEEQSRKQRLIFLYLRPSEKILGLIYVSFFSLTLSAHIFLGT